MVFCYTVYTFSLDRLTPVRYLPECLRDSRSINISVIDTVRPRLLCVRALGKLCKLVPYIGLSRREDEERERSVCVAARVCVCVCACAFTRACVRICVMWVRCLSRGQNDQLSPQSRFIRVPSPLVYPA